MKKLILYLIIFLIPLPFFGQEYLSAINGNSILQGFQKYHKQSPLSKSSFYLAEPLLLPFYDDFSKITIYPDTSRWVDNEAFINSTFAYFPPNYGVATLDAIDADGNVYSNATPYTFQADKFTSKPIRLDAEFNANGDSIRPLTLADSIYFSFYYQPQGLGDVPLLQDSLVLEFGYYNEDTVFSHFDYVLVYGYQYAEAMQLFGGEWLPPDYVILPYEYCDSIPTVLQDTFYIYDSLLIPCDSVFTLGVDWESVWHAEGDTLEVFLDEKNVFFEYVVIPMDSVKWLRNDFQFRFKNYASISNINSWQSNTDHWHLDNIYLNWGRTREDKFSNEVSFIRDGQSFVTDYTSMPYGHYAGDPVFYRKDSMEVFVNNLDSIDHTFRYNYYVQNELGDTLPNYLIADTYQFLSPYFSQDVDYYPPFTKPPIKYYFISPSDDTANFRISHVVYNSEDLSIGDTLIYKQKFRNYFSYDDGSAEAGYGLSPGGSKLAIRFKSELVDSLRGVQMFFNKTFNENNNYLFHITVWNDNNGIPGEELFQYESVRPEFTDSLNKFYTYIFPEPFKLGINQYYIGWEQTTNHNLNIGFDRNTNSKSKNFYNTNGTWVNSSFEGSIMIRPVVGKPIPLNTARHAIEKGKLIVYPNPVRSGDHVNIKINESNYTQETLKDIFVNISDMYGKTMLHMPYAEKINTSQFRPGLYILSLYNNSYSIHHSAKLLISK
ncbi:MAG: T9SS type A sorting domain-containing protein [Bacteroidales bacterium]